ncbi:hypothetical protein, partial [Carbonactinospora thermoautotrophica]
LVLRYRAEQAWQAQRASEAEARRVAERLRAERNAAMPVLRQPWTERWWRTATPEQIGQVWQVAAGWAGAGDPYAQATLRHLREQIATRYGVQVPDVAVEPRGLVELLAAGRQETARTASHREGPEEFTESGPAYRYRVRDTRFPAAAPWEGTVQVPDGTPVEVVAANQLKAVHAQLESRHDGQPASLDTFLIEVFADVGADAEPLCVLTGDRVDAVLAEVADRHRRIVAGEETAAPEQLREALLAERWRVWEETQAAEAALAQALGDGADETSPEAARCRERLADARERLAQLNLRVRMVEADLRGEDGRLVAQVAALRQMLDEEWWATASPQEVGGVWEWVAQRRDGTAKTQADALLRAGIWRTYGVDIRGQASGEDVAAVVADAQAAAERAAGEADRRRHDAREEDAAAARAEDAATRLEDADEAPEVVEG